MAERCVALEALHLRVSSTMRSASMAEWSVAFPLSAPLLFIYMRCRRVESRQNYGCYIQDLNSTGCRAITGQEENSRSVYKDRIITKVYRQVQALIWTI